MLNFIRWFLPNKEEGRERGTEGGREWKELCLANFVEHDPESPEGGVGRGRALMAGPFRVSL